MKTGLSAGDFWHHKWIVELLGLIRTILSSQFSHWLFHLEPSIFTFHVCYIHASMLRIWGVGVNRTPGWKSNCWCRFSGQSNQSQLADFTTIAPKSE